MSLKLSKTAMIFVSFAVLLAMGLSGCDLPFGGNANNQQPSQPTQTSTSNIIVQENALPGTTQWMIPQGQEATTQIQAYASATSVQSGDTLVFYVSTEQEGTPYTIDIFRLGWYGGKGGRLMTSITNQVGFAQGYYNNHTHQLVGCTSCSLDPATDLVEANWLPSSNLTIPPDWVTGVYLAKFTDESGFQTYAPFDVRGNAHSAYIAVTSDTTYAAYNYWGGFSLYDADDAEGIANLKRAVKVSFNRPYEQGYGSGHVLIFEADAIHWLERMGYDLSYISSIDLHENPAQLVHHRAYISLGHDEYWTKEMRNGVERARNQGVGLAFLGANASYWQMRFEPDKVGVPDRTIVSYKVLTEHNDLKLDPFYGKDNSRVTTQWRDPFLKRPENALIGIMYSSLTQQLPGFAWQLNPTAKSPLLDGTDLQPGKQYGCGLVGYEWDRVFDNGATPPGLQVLGMSPSVDSQHKPDVSNTTYYIASSGAMVFATGSIFWAASLDGYRYELYKSCPNVPTVVPGMQKLMAHVMDALIVHHPSK